MLYPSAVKLASVCPEVCVQTQFGVLQSLISPEAAKYVVTPHVYQCANHS